MEGLCADRQGRLAALMMDIQARYLVFNSALVLLAGLLVGVPYWSGRPSECPGSRHQGVAIGTRHSDVSARR